MPSNPRSHGSVAGICHSPVSAMSSPPGRPELSCERASPSQLDQVGPDSQRHHPVLTKACRMTRGCATIRPDNGLDQLKDRCAHAWSSIGVLAARGIGAADGLSACRCAAYGAGWRSLRDRDDTSLTDPSRWSVRGSSSVCRPRLVYRRTFGRHATSSDTFDDCAIGAELKESIAALAGMRVASG